MERRMRVLALGDKPQLGQGQKAAERAKEKTKTEDWKKCQGGKSGDRTG